MSAGPPIDVVESVDPVSVSRRIALVRPDQRPAVRTIEEKYVMTFPNLIVREVILFQLVVIGLALAAIAFDAPLEGIANPLETPNPAKAPWYFLGLQELLHYFPPVVAGVVMPLLVVVALVVIPYARINLTAGPLWAGSGAQRAPLLLLVGGRRRRAPRRIPVLAHRGPDRGRPARDVRGAPGLRACSFHAREGDAPGVDHGLVRDRRDHSDRHRDVLPRPRLVVRVALDAVRRVLKGDRECHCADSSP